MGKKLSKLFSGKQIRILMLGLDAAGKTTILVCSLTPCVSFVRRCR